MWVQAPVDLFPFERRGDGGDVEGTDGVECGKSVGIIVLRRVDIDQVAASGYAGFRCGRFGARSWMAVQICSVMLRACG